ncbi:MAG: hypothetical protein A4E62_01521 [Syntrophorhabdus sp. PtaU1.Bin002]|nr:MAG: hypothetical protein A4E58_01412 [Syntrophorhabdus sp. PtaB.Bin006]OPY70637.1 MAG: hypothetical protein A4E62_01521 [Syntrophorhabdus sp. PtaU1.Bin002]
MQSGVGQVRTGLPWEALTTELTGGTCKDTSSTNRLDLLGIETESGIEYEWHKLVTAPPPCCSALIPLYWGRVIGCVTSARAGEITVRVAVTLFDNNAQPLDTYSDFLAIEAEEKEQFDVRIKDLPLGAKAYGITIKIVDLEEVPYIP